MCNERAQPEFRWRTHRFGALAIGLGLLALLMLAGCHEEPESKAAPVEDGVQSAADSTARYGRAEDVRFTRKPIERVEPAPRPTEPVAEDVSCISAECHATYATSSFVHEPVASGSCETCHGEDAGDHTYPLIRQGNDNCTFCHAVTEQKQHQHAAVADSGCITCHDPHASVARHLIRDLSVQRLCARCHDMPLQAFSHEPFLEGECMICHDPHESNFSPLLRAAEGSDHCLSCHQDLGNRLSEAAYIHDPVRQDCAGCHDAHTSSHTAQLNEAPQDLCANCHESVGQQVLASKVQHGAVTDGSSCANCHDPHAAGHAQLLPGPEDQLCLQCHDRAITRDDGHVVHAVSESLSRKFLHGPIRSGECSPCHGTHGTDHANILHTAFPDKFYASFQLENYALCFSCHEQELATLEKTESLTGFRDGDVNLHYLHVNRAEKGRTCKTCHDIHGSDQPNHMATDVPFEGSNWAMPMRYQPAPTGGSCAPGCHEAKTYNRQAPATLPSESLTERGAP